MTTYKVIAQYTMLELVVGTQPLLQLDLLVVTITKKRKEKEKLTPVHCTGMNTSPLSKCQTRQVVLWHKGLCLLWEVGSGVCKYFFYYYYDYYYVVVVVRGA